MNNIQAHRGPDDQGIWIHERRGVGFAHRRLSIIDLSSGHQPMGDQEGNWIVLNGEIYNFIELRRELGVETFATQSDTEVVLSAYRKWGFDCVNLFRGMFAFALWDEQRHLLFCARDRFGIKPFYYTGQSGCFFFASEAKTLLPFLPDIQTDVEGLKDYLVFQFCLDGKTLFKDISELQPGRFMTIDQNGTTIRRYWEVFYENDFEHTAFYFQNRLRELLEESIDLHLRSDVPVGAYISGGVDSSVLATLASKREKSGEFLGFHGKFSRYGQAYDETSYARELAAQAGITLKEIDLDSRDFADSIRKIVYHLDFPVAGPGSFPQYMVSSLAARDRKVVLGGQGGDEIFGGYVRYLIAYFEQCIKGAIDGTLHSGNFVVTYESIIPNLIALQSYKPLLKDFFGEGMFDPHDRRYFRLINRAASMGSEIRWDELGDYRPYETFRKIYYGDNVGHEAYFDSMTHFDFKTLLPALLQVEDRMSMAHGLESRVPLLDHPIVEFAASIPADIKFKDGTLKMIFLKAVADLLPESILRRKNKMGFPVPFSEWVETDLRDMITDVFRVQKEKKRPFFNTDEILRGLGRESKYGRKLWGLLSLELWHQEFHDQADSYKSLLKEDHP